MAERNFSFWFFRVISVENIDPIQNLLLASLPVEELARIVPMLRPISIVRKTVIYGVGDVIDYLYFPSGGLVAEVATLADGGGLEVVSVGREGAFGITALFGLDTSSHEVSVQMTGAAWRVSVSGMKRILEDCPVLKDKLTRCFHSWYLQVSQVAVCTGRHTLSQRCANKLLSASVRSGSTSLPLTHENLAYALGVRRAGITNAMAALEDEGTIRCMRGSVEIVDVGRLRESACNCSACHTRSYQSLFSVKAPVATETLPADGR
jgi:CRP-like cAMP-binding protein